MKQSVVTLNFNTWKKAVSFTEGNLMLKLRYQFLSREPPGQSCSSELIFPIFLQIGILKLWVKDLIGIKNIFKYFKGATNL